MYLYKQDGTFVNGDLVRDGFARAKAYKPNVKYASQFSALQAEAQAKGAGLWGACADAKTPGKGFDPNRAMASSAKSRPAPPAVEQAALKNPGDVKNCSDFATYAEAKSYYDTYFPRFGDVAKLDGDGDGVPCEGLRRNEGKR